MEVTSRVVLYVRQFHKSSQNMPVQHAILRRSSKKESASEKSTFFLSSVCRYTVWHAGSHQQPQCVTLPRWYCMSISPHNYIISCLRGFCLFSSIPLDKRRNIFNSCNAFPGSSLHLLPPQKKTNLEGFICAESEAFTLCLNYNFMLKLTLFYPSGKSNLWNAVFVSVFSYTGCFVQVAEGIKRNLWRWLV